MRTFGGRLLHSAAAAGVTISETLHAPLTRLPRHAHEDASFCLVSRGALRESSAARSADFATGDVIFRPGEAWHSNEFLSAGARCFNLAIGGTLRDRTRATPRISPEVLALLRRLQREVRDGDSPLIVEGLALQLIGEAFERSAEPRRTPAWMRHVDAILRDRFAEPLTVRELAMHAGVHPVHLARTFRSLRGATIPDTIRRLRIDHARELLRDPRASLAEVAIVTGFADQSQFTKVFRRVTGVTPGRGRKG